MERRNIETVPTRRRIISSVEVPVAEEPTSDQRTLVRRSIATPARRHIGDSGNVDEKLLVAPYPYFGGKSGVANEIWSRLDPKTLDCYIEPCMGSAATYLVRPQPWVGREVLNDYDALLVNAWRAISRHPDEVAEICNGIMLAEMELHAIHSHLTRSRDRMRKLVGGSTDFCDVQLGAWWLWGICMKLGGGFCSGDGPWYVINDELVCLEKDDPRRDGNGITCSVPCVGNRGVLRQELDYLKSWMRALSYRMRQTLVLSGDWSRAVTPAFTGTGKIGIMFDPPYGADANFNGTLYTNQDADISTKIKEWCIQHTDPAWCRANKDTNIYRIAYCGYTPEGDILEQNGWAVHAWTAAGGYGNQGQDGANKKVEKGGQFLRGNAGRERVWFSPACGSGSDIWLRFGKK